MIARNRYCEKSFINSFVKLSMNEKNLIDMRKKHDSFSLDN